MTTTPATMTPETITIKINVREETRTGKELGRLVDTRTVVLPAEACKMYFDYQRAVGYPAITVALKDRGLLPALPYGQSYWVSIIDQ